MVIPKTVTLTRITENQKCTEVKLDPEDMRRLRELDRNCRALTVNPYIECRRNGVPTVMETLLIGDHGVSVDYCGLSL